MRRLLLLAVALALWVGVTNQLATQDHFAAEPVFVAEAPALDIAPAAEAPVVDPIGLTTSPNTGVLTPPSVPSGILEVVPNKDIAADAARRKASEARRRELMALVPIA